MRHTPLAWLLIANYTDIVNEYAVYCILAVKVQHKDKNIPDLCEWYMAHGFLLQFHMAHNAAIAFLSHI